MGVEVPIFVGAHCHVRTYLKSWTADEVSGARGQPPLEGFTLYSAKGYTKGTEELDMLPILPFGDGLEPDM